MSKYEYTTDTIARLLPEQIGDYLVHHTRVTIIPEGEPLYSAKGIDIEIDVEDGIEYVKIKQNTDYPEEGMITLDAKDWPVLRQVIDAMIARCRVEQEVVDGQP